MPITPTDIRYVLSGGTYNADPNKSLGGEPSLQTIWGLNNNLFADVTSIQAEDGYTDYRCLYIVNNNATDSFYDAKVIIETQVELGSNIEIGTLIRTDIQQIIVSGIAEGGSFTIRYEDISMEIPWHVDLLRWAQNIENALNALPDLGGVKVNPSAYPNQGSTRDMTRVFEISFEGVSNFRYHPVLVLVSNDIIAPTKPIIQVLKIQDGCPINSIAATIDVPTIEPVGIDWQTPTMDTPLVIGTMRPADACPIWVKRTTPAKSAPLASDGFILRTYGKPFA